MEKTINVLGGHCKTQKAMNIEIIIVKAEAEIAHRQRMKEDMETANEQTIRIMELMADEICTELSVLVQKMGWADLSRSSLIRERTDPCIDISISMRQASLNIEVQCSRERKNDMNYFVNPSVAIPGNYDRSTYRYRTVSEMFACPIFEEYIVSLIIKNHESI